MPRKKIDKSSLEYLCDHLFHKDSIIGFGFTINHITMTMISHLNKSATSCVIDCSETKVGDLIGEEVFHYLPIGNYCESFNKKISEEQIESLKTQFKNLNYEVETGVFAGKWTWIKISCNSQDIPMHVKKIKENVTLS